MNMKKIFKINGMHCNSCSMLIENELKDRVENVEASYSKGQVKIQFNPKKVSEKEIKKIIEKAAQNAVRSFEKLQDAIFDLRRFAESLFVGPLSILSPERQLQQARQQFLGAFNLASSGDVDALDDLQDAAEILLEQARSFFASSQGFTDIVNFVQRALGQTASSVSRISREDLFQRELEILLTEQGLIADLVGQAKLTNISIQQIPF